MECLVFGRGVSSLGTASGLGRLRSGFLADSLPKRRKKEGKGSALALFRGPPQADIATCYKTDTCVVPGTCLKSWDWGVNLNRGLLFG